MILRAYLLTTTTAPHEVRTVYSSSLQLSKHVKEPWTMAINRRDLHKRPR